MERSVVPNALMYVCSIINGPIDADLLPHTPSVKNGMRHKYVLGIDIYARVHKEETGNRKV